ncbi:ATP-dependent DNA helicase RecG [Ruania halotolerans]|uniref:ATP-dependent DNA helicase RecG n=1 Tax=Ruania halotolerans TaxID=2897773 RepID=UPI001E374799|nr:ATP-dependent DNA helicase RecG [Ruania halotolerans]UFU07836.1 ATP-dependent DNA helicase RecG [Ruania halotolerans]
MAETVDPADADAAELMTRRLARAVGPATAKALGTLGIRSTDELLRHFPRRYLHRGKYTPLADLVPGEHATVMAEVADIESRPARNRKLQVVKVTITDGHTRLPLTFFARNGGMVAHLRRQLPLGASAMFSGQVSLYQGAPQLTHPEYEPLEDEADESLVRAHVNRPVPVYPATAKLPSWKIAKAIRMVLDPMSESDTSEWLPDDVVQRRHLPAAGLALRMIHQPTTDEEWKQAQRRYRYEEAFILQTALARRRADIASYDATPRPPRPDALVDALDEQLPFALTAGQLAVSEEIGADLAGDEPMQRLLQGEVGSGKTVVALRAMLQVIDAGGQAALLAPTEVLAQQHARSIAHLLGPLGEAGMLGGAADGTRIALLTGSMGAAARRQALADAASGAAGIVIGTHALLSEQVQFADLGLTVVDEQHRFGVEQRDALRAKGRTMPHQLFLTATPIPRSVAMTFFGDVDVSTLREIPAGRPPVETFRVPADKPRWLARTWEKVAEEVGKGNRAYVVAPRITSSTPEDDAGPVVTALRATDAVGGGVHPGEPSTVEDTYAALGREPALAGVALAMMHGRLSAEEKDAAMSDFAAGRTPVLVTTTVIEVGVDVPEATVMVILDADRFGISQLHQLRGRVGRGTAPGTCLLVSAAPEQSPAWERLNALVETTDGFVLAERDLEQRREGDVLGAAQSGRGNSLTMLRVLRDRELIEQARDDARALIAIDPNLAHHPEVLTEITRLVDPDHEEYLDRA